MIKINLHSEKKRTPGTVALPKGPGGGVGSRNILLVAIVVVGLLIAAFWNYRLNAQVDEWQKKNTAAEAELLRLEAIRKKGEKFEARKVLLARKIDLITELKKQQAVPVHILDQISWNLPDFLWLKNMSVGNNGINLVGQATTYNAVTNFYNNLSDSDYFTGVTMGRVAESDKGVSFSLTCRFVPPGTTEGEEEETEPGTNNEG